VVTGDLNAVGVWFYAYNTQRYLYLMRNDPKHLYHWGLPGGKVEHNETLQDTIVRECTEEMGSMPEYIKLVPIEQYTGPNNHFVYHTFFCLVANEFVPVLNDEHLGYAWLDRGVIPKPLHPGLWATINVEDIYTKIETVENLYSYEISQ
jgi:ADP-ribose pyrophosphatase YjhB (NUDIX family)